jgi:hypothetical protein
MRSGGLWRFCVINGISGREGRHHQWRHTLQYSPSHRDDTTHKDEIIVSFSATSEHRFIVRILERYSMDQ